MTTDRDDHLVFVRQWELVDLISRLGHVFDTTGAVEEACWILDWLRLVKGASPMSDSPVFVCEFEDGQRTRMTTYQSHAGLDLRRGVKLARHAYRSRMQTDRTPPIKAAQYEDGESGAVIKTYSKKELDECAVK